METTDLFRGAYLLTQGGRLAGTRVVRGQVFFVIEGEGVAEHDERYRVGRALVNPVQLRETLNLLRDLVFERVRPERRRSDARAHSDREPRAFEALR